LRNHGGKKESLSWEGRGKDSLPPSRLKRGEPNRWREEVHNPARASVCWLSRGKGRGKGRKGPFLVPLQRGKRRNSVIVEKGRRNKKKNKHKKKKEEEARKNFLSSPTSGGGGKGRNPRRRGKKGGYQEKGKVTPSNCN